jgi:archaellin
MVLGDTIGLTMGEVDACTQLELLLIIGCFVAVTALFSYLTLGAGLLSDTGSAGDAYPILAREESSLELAGPVTASATVQTWQDWQIDTLTFGIAHTGKGDPVDLARLTVTIMTADYLDILVRSATAPPAPGEWAVSVIRERNRDDLLGDGEVCVIALHLPRPILAGEDLVVKVRPEGGAPFSFTETVRAPATDNGASLPAEKD